MEVEFIENKKELMGRKLLENFVFSEESVEKYKCNICHLLLKEPLQRSCGCVACRECCDMNWVVGEICPIDGETISEDEEMFQDKAKEKEILNLKCKCKNSQYGCKWKGLVKDTEAHICPFARMECKHCSMAYMKSEEMQHFQQCDGIFNSEDCIYKRFGCTFKTGTRNEMKNHLEENTVWHMVYQSQHHEQIEEYNKKMLQALLINTEKQKRTERLQKKNILDLENSNKRLLQLHEQTQQELCNLKEMFNDVISNSKRRNSTATESTESASLKLSDAVKKNNIALSDLDLRFQLHENASYNGRLVWKINKFNKRREDAVDGKIPALYSAPFFTKQYGYKLCARLYLNGDGAARDTHLSLFIVIMKSEYDSLLEWPFHQQVKFTLINQRFNRFQNIVKRLNPTKSSSSFQMPVKNMNIASGVPKFAEIFKLEEEGFLYNDTIFIEIET